jgi:hypothetical protein
VEQRESVLEDLVFWVQRVVNLLPSSVLFDEILRERIKTIASFPLVR